MLKKKDRIVSSIRNKKTRYLKKSYKFGIDLIKTVKQNLALNVKNSNTLYADTIAESVI